MLASSIPAYLPEPWGTSATGGTIRSIPTTTSDPNAASLALGFPANNFVSVLLGGVGPNGEDFNGIFNWLSAINQWFQAGGQAVYNSAFSAAIGGYPNGAVLVKASGTGFWRSSVDNNTSDPDTGGANWTSFGDTIGWKFTSSPVAISTGALLEAAHGLGIVPTKVRTILKCISAELGYSVNDTIDVAGIYAAATSGNGVTTFADATNVGMVISASAPIYIVQKSTPWTTATITLAKWEIIFYANP